MMTLNLSSPGLKMRNTMGTRCPCSNGSPLPWTSVLKYASSPGEEDFNMPETPIKVGQLSLGKEAELAGWNKLRFGDELGRLKLPEVNLDDQEIQAELHAIRGKAG
jgi:hypothetical protein